MTSSLVIDDEYALGAALTSLVCRLCVPLCLCGKRSSPQRHRDVRREAEIRGATAVLNKPVTFSPLSGTTTRWRASWGFGSVRVSTTAGPQLSIC